MTDPEIVEPRYPVRQEPFGIRHESGGKGKWTGGNGSVRRIRFLELITAVIVSSRRNVAPFGLGGGADRAELEPGDVFVIQTPGGGGYGAA